VKILKERSNIYNKIEMDKEKKLESFSIMDPIEKKKMDQSVKSVAIDPKQFTNTISSFSKKVQDLSLNQFCIKGSVNSAYTGDYITPTMVQYVLSRGCRALDFEIYMDGEERPIVGYSPDQTALNPSSRHTSNKKFPYLRDVLKITIQSAFNSTNGTAYTTPNKDDPLFINIRLKTDANNKSRLFNLVQDDLRDLRSDFRSYFYASYLDPSGTKIQELKRKVIFIFESNANGANGASLPANTSLGYIYNLLTGSNVNVRNYYQLFPNSSQATPPIIEGNNRVITDATNGTIPFTMVLPDTGKSKQPNMNIFSSIQNYGYQMNMMQYYVNDLLLIQNEDIFNTYNGGIVPMAYCLTYTRNYATKDDVIPGVNTVFPTVFAGITRDSWLPNDV
jgi:hypothetical protein